MLAMASLLKALLVLEERLLQQPWQQIPKSCSTIDIATESQIVLWCIAMFCSALQCSVMFCSAL